MPVVFCLVALALTQSARQSVEITRKHNDPREEQTRAQLQRLLASYDVSPWLFTRKVVIESGAVSHSHPVLTLNTRHRKDDELCLAAFVHEQLHWYLDARPKETAAASQELKTVFPNAPLAYPAGADSAESTYHHLCAR